ncbi:hypothetical protein AVEN_274686-1 [Araneus ventricosus]|uniref:Uncharacterized protein n=1 Tax=Araneus ventricosus TaxID=182803 RepID=A0A4Y2P733_ARAVE|nr:hypothetical protein AVEN_54482-1 [Araneus ventricosus]GBN46819.1 hypothetical protein AVEN_274686-1 [Araneus ventricosus]
MKVYHLLTAAAYYKPAKIILIHSGFERTQVFHFNMMIRSLSSVIRRPRVDHVLLNELIPSCPVLNDTSPYFIYGVPTLIGEKNSRTFHGP